MTYRVYWRTWERGSVEVEAASEDEAREKLYELLGSLEPSDEGVDVEDVEETDE
jgi:ribosomal protein L20A (L18A)